MLDASYQVKWEGTAPLPLKRSTEQADLPFPLCPPKGVADGRNDFTALDAVRWHVSIAPTLKPAALSLARVLSCRVSSS